METTAIEHVLLGGTAVLLVAIVAARVTIRAGLPTLLVFLVLGVAIGRLPLPTVHASTAESLGVPERGAACSGDVS